MFTRWIYSKPGKVAVALLVIFLGFVYLNNTSLLAEPPGDRPVLLAHRAVGQPYDRTGLTNQTCTAAKMIPVDHDYLENTIPSMATAFEYGADIVEFDIHQTVDDRFAVFHDWTIDCRTNGTGITREQTLNTLQALDIGYGYTADGGQSWPFRGKGVGLMPSLEEVLTTFPARNFLIDIKSNDPTEGELLTERLTPLLANRTGEIMVYGGALPVNVIRERLPQVKTLTRPQLRQCLTQYLALGWTGWVPSACGRSVLMVPANVAPWLWGWPNRFLQRMDGAGSYVMLIGDYWGEGFSQGFDDPARLPHLPTDYTGGIWTDRIDLIGPAVVTPTPPVESPSLAAGPSPSPSPKSNSTPTPPGYDATVTAPAPSPTPDEISRIKAANANQPEIMAPLLTPDGATQAQTLVYGCVEIESKRAMAYEQLVLTDLDSGAETVVAEQLQNCGGLAAAGLAALFWSPSSRYLYYTDARDGMPDGCGFWQPTILRWERTTGQTERLGGGVPSPDGTRLAVWLPQERAIVVWDTDGGELGRLPAAADAFPGQIAWSPDGQALVYLQVSSYCPPAGPSYVVRLDADTFEQSVLLEAEQSFRGVAWEQPGQLHLTDASGQVWTYNLNGEALEQVDLTMAAMETVVAFNQTEGVHATGPFLEISAALWHPAIAALQPRRVYWHQNNLAVVLAETDATETGLYIAVPISSYAPQNDETVQFTPEGDGLFRFNKKRSD